MATKKQTNKEVRAMRPALTPEADQLQLISMAHDYAREQMANGTASSQIVTHFLKLGTEQAKVELEKTKLERDLVSAKTETLRLEKESARDYKMVIDALKEYNGHSTDEF